MTLFIPNKTNLRGLLRSFQTNNFAKNLSSLGLSQIIVRISRLFATIILSRLLSPQDFGTAAIVLTVYELIALFTRNGISAKVVQASKDEVNVVAMTAWRMTWIVCGSLMVLQCLLAYPIAWFFQDARIAIPIAAMSIIYLATPMSNIQSAFQQREGNLRRIAFAGALQIVVDNILTVIFAVLGFGLWSIILPKILVAPIWLYLVRVGHSWRPNKIEGVGRFHGWKNIATFSRSVLGTEVLSTFQGNIDNLFVGYFLGLHALGIYYFAFNAGLGITLGLITAAGVAVFPYLCEVKQDTQLLASRFYSIRKKLGLGMFCLILTQTALAPIYVPIIFGPKWVEAIPILCVICLSALARPFAGMASQLLKAVGSPHIEFRWQIVNTIALILAVLVGAQFSVLAVAIAVFVVQTLFLSLFSYFVPLAILEVGNNDVELYRQNRDRNPVLNWLNFSKVS
jgi:teichuronic acid exporter